MKGWSNDTRIDEQKGPTLDTRPSTPSEPKIEKPKRLKKISTWLQGLCVTQHFVLSATIFCYSKSFVNLRFSILLFPFKVISTLGRNLRRVFGLCSCYIMHEAE